MLAAIRKVWTPSFIRAACERNQSAYIDPVNRQEDLWQNAREKMAAALEALTAYHHQVNTLGGPDGNSVAELVNDVCADETLHVIARQDYDDLEEEAKLLGKMVGEMECACKTGDTGLVKEALDNCTRFTKNAHAAYLNHVS